MNKAITVIIISILLVASFFTGYFIHKESTLQSSINESSIDESPEGAEDEKTTILGIPAAVSAKYDELRPQSRMGADIESCVKNTEKIYVVSGSSGFAVWTFYYTENGDEISSDYFDDTLDDNEPRPPVNLQEYECTIIAESTPSFNEQ